MDETIASASELHQVTRCEESVMHDVAALTYRGLFRFRSVTEEIDGDKLNSSLLLVENGDGKQVYWWLAYALRHSAEISNFDQFVGDYKSERVRFSDEDVALWDAHEAARAETATTH